MPIWVLGSLGFILVLNMVWEKNLKTETQSLSSAFSEIFEEIQKKLSIKVEQSHCLNKEKTFGKFYKKKLTRVGRQVKKIKLKTFAVLKSIVNQC